MIDVKQIGEQQITKYFWELYRIDCRDKGLEPLVENFNKWCKYEYPEIIKANIFAKEIMEGRPF